MLFESWSSTSRRKYISTFWQNVNIGSFSDCWDHLNLVIVFGTVVTSTELLHFESVLVPLIKFEGYSRSLIQMSSNSVRMFKIQTEYIYSKVKHFCLSKNKHKNTLMPAFPWMVNKYEFFESLHDDSLCPASHVHISLTRSKKSEKKKKTLLFFFPFLNVVIFFFSTPNIALICALKNWEFGYICIISNWTGMAKIVILSPACNNTEDFHRQQRCQLLAVKKEQGRSQ